MSLLPEHRKSHPDHKKELLMAARGDINGLTNLMENPCGGHFTRCDSSLLETAAYNDQHKCVQWMLENKWEITRGPLAEAIARGDSVNCLRVVRKCKRGSRELDTDMLLSYVSMFGALKCLKYLHEAGIKYDTREVVENVCRRGHPDMLKYLREVVGCRWRGDYVIKTIDKGFGTYKRLACARYLLKTGCHLRKSEAMRCAIEEKNEDFVLFLIGQGCELTDEVLDVII